MDLLRCPIFVPLRSPPESIAVSLIEARGPLLPHDRSYWRMDDHWLGDVQGWPGLQVKSWVGGMRT